MTARGNLSSVYSITDNTRCKSRTVTTPSGPLEVPELSCEPGRQKQKRLGLFLSLRRRYKLKSVMAKYAFNSFIKQLSLKRSNTTSLCYFSSPLIRRMFPSMRVKVRNLDPCQQYYIAMDVMPVDSKRYR